eukprot:gnl/MRDRNA2_/MRDRNA2_203112_c0_seq1.p1 gnl/MRDRNA2_/MRDRNA2_203112_c0~~gnl/MRDRNA2_/MRDRNA2_203112_c0_seq1.p1  ORF type:complete len:424 (-),score=76.41 gnl/MRDRNA2_/MRDRNA2_203112_c0_seq1:98-1303(-)
MGGNMGCCSRSDLPGQIEKEKGSCEWEDSGSCARSLLPAPARACGATSVFWDDGFLPTPGSIFDHYTVGELIGTGTFGQVRCCEKILGRTTVPLAVKVVDKESTGVYEHSAFVSAREEAAILRSVRHDHIVRLFDVFEEDRFLYVVMERVNGGELFKRLAEPTAKICESDVAKVGVQLFQALVYLHHHNIVHRDVKAENILLTSPVNSQGKDFGSIKVIDFGLACRCGGGCSLLDSSPLSLVCGSPTYMAPEILEGKYGLKVDVWAAAVVLYVALFAQYPFYSADTNQLNELILSDATPAWSSSGQRGWMPSLQSVDFLTEVMEKNPANRPSAKEALELGFLKDAEHIEPVEIPLSVRRKSQMLAIRAPVEARHERRRTQNFLELQGIHAQGQLKGYVPIG